MLGVEYIERSIQAYRVESSIDFDEIKNVIKYIYNIKRNNPNDILLDVGEATRFLYMSQSGLEYHRGGYHRGEVLWIKFGWARRSGLPETLDASTGRTEVLRLPSGIFLYEPSHFLLFPYRSYIVALYEYNHFAPRPARLCQYIAEYYKKMKGNPKARVRIYARRLFTKDIEILLREFDIVKSIRVVLTSSSVRALEEALGSGAALEQLLNQIKGSRTLAITWGSSPRTELEISIEDVLDLFRRVEDNVKSFVVSVKKGHIGRSQRIDLKKNAVIFRKRIRLARDKDGNLLRSTDTRDAIDVLKSVIDAVVNQLD